MARGYWRREELTRERFVPSPFVPDALLYRTGDLARFLADGTLECLGRMDGQVKLRGYRIELGEIESTLNSHPAIQQCAVIVREDAPGDAQLVAYFEARGASAPTASDLRAYAEKDLPAYMVPSVFVAMEKLPLTPNDKVDRKALPAPTRRVSVKTGYVAPRDATEQLLAQIWAKVLKVKRVGLHDNFFDLGGHSLLAVRVAAEIENHTKTRLPLASILQSPTIAELAEDLRRPQWQPSWSSLVPLRTSGSRPPLFLMHAHGGNVLEYHALAELLDHDQPVYAFQARGLDGNIPTDCSIEEIVSSYIEELRSLQPEGPYFLAGFCVGGLLALEAAQQLTDAGQEVALVMVMQTMHPDVFRRTEEIPILPRLWYQLIKRIDLERENLSHAGKGRIHILERCRRAWDLLHARVTIAYHKLSGKRPADLSVLPRLYIFEALSMEFLNAVRKYSPRPYAGDVVLFRASKQLRGLETDMCLGWKHHLHGNLEVCEVPGHQQNLMLLPNVKQLASALATRLKAAQQRCEGADEQRLQKAGSAAPRIVNAA